MISIEQALQRLHSLEPEISRLYAGPVPDYRGRIVDAGSVRRYFISEQRRMAEVAALLPDLPADGARLLDVGIAYGFLPVLLQAESSWHCEGLELAENIPVYCALARHHGIPLHPGKLGATPLPFPDGSFQAVIFSEVIEHLRLSPLLVLRELRRLLKPGGWLILTTPNMARFAHWTKLLFGQNPLEAFPDVATENITEHLTHIREYTMGELRELLPQAGFQIVEARYSACMERNRPHFFVTALVPPWRGNLMVLARKNS